MNYWFNLVIIIAIILFVAILLYFKLVQSARKSELKEVNNRQLYSLDTVLTYIKKRLTEISSRDLYKESLSEEEYKRRVRRREELNVALKNCNTGDLSSKIFVREYIYELLVKEYGFDEEKVDFTIPFDNPVLMSSREKFETVLYLVSKKYGNEALGYIIKTFNLAEPKPNGSYYVTDEEVEHIYKTIVRGNSILFEDKMRVITQLIYAQYKGFGVIDEIRDMSIDGVSGGVSGLPNRMTHYTNDTEMLEKVSYNPTGLNSVWVIHKGISIHMRFLAFEHEAELIRVVTNIYKFNTPGQLSENRPAIINEMYDGSRVTVVRPKLSESWAFFIRKKFDAKLLKLNELFTANNSQLVIGTMEYLMRGQRTCALTGGQGSGKTTTLMGMIHAINPALKLRILETKFELNLRSIYPDRNILTFQETDTFSGQDGLDLQKKTDGDVTILGEIATDPVAAWAIQTAQVASLFTLFTHHAKTFADLVYALRNSLLKVGMFNNESIAEQQVVSVLEFDIHMKATIDGYRYIERITECIPIQYEDESETLNRVKTAESQDEKVAALIDVASIYFRQQTQRKHFIERNIIEYRDGEYVAVNPISEKRQAEIRSCLTEEQKTAFNSFMKTNWEG